MLYRYKDERVTFPQTKAISDHKIKTKVTGTQKEGERKEGGSRKEGRQTQQTDCKETLLLKPMSNSKSFCFTKWILNSKVSEISGK